MGSGGSKNNLDAGFDPKNRRPSQHELTNPPTESRGSIRIIHKFIRHQPKIGPQSTQKISPTCGHMAEKINVMSNEITGLF